MIEIGIVRRGHLAPFGICSTKVPFRQSLYHSKVSAMLARKQPENSRTCPGPDQRNAAAVPTLKSAREAITSEVM